MHMFTFSLLCSYVFTVTHTHTHTYRAQCCNDDVSLWCLSSLPPRESEKTPVYSSCRCSCCENGLTGAGCSRLIKWAKYVWAHGADGDNGAWVSSKVRPISHSGVLLREEKLRLKRCFLPLERFVLSVSVSHVYFLCSFAEWPVAAAAR